MNLSFRLEGGISLNGSYFGGPENGLMSPKLKIATDCCQSVTCPTVATSP
jgi:hypothetical protein